MNADEVQKLLKRVVREFSAVDPAAVPNEVSERKSTSIIELFGELQRFEIGADGAFVSTAATPPRRKTEASLVPGSGSVAALAQTPVVQLVVGSAGLLNYIRTVLQRARQLCEMGHYRVALLACLAPLWSVFKADQSSTAEGITGRLVAAASANLAAAGMGGSEVEQELRKLKEVRTLLQYLEQYPPFMPKDGDAAKEDDAPKIHQLSKKAKARAMEEAPLADPSGLGVAMTPEAIAKVAVGSWKMRRSCRQLTELYLLFSEARVLTAACEFRLLIEMTDVKCLDHHLSDIPSTLLPDGNANLTSRKIVHTPRTHILRRLQCIGHVLEDVTDIDREDYYFFVYNTSLEIYNLCTTCFIPFAERHEESTSIISDGGERALSAGALQELYGEPMPSLLHEAVMILTFVGRYCDSILPLATVRYVSWRVQIYHVVCTCYEKQGNYCGALVVARYISDLVRELFELEVGDVVPPAPDQLQELQAVTNRCRILELKYSWATRQQMESGALTPTSNAITAGLSQGLLALSQLQSQESVGGASSKGKAGAAAATSKKPRTWWQR